MTIQVRCDKCNKQYSASTKIRGKQMRCFKCGNMIDVPPDAPEEKADLSVQYEIAPAGTAAAAEAAAAKAAGGGSAASAADPAAFLGTFGSRMREELGVLRTENGWLQFLLAHKLMVGVIGLAFGAFLAWAITGRLGVGFLAMAAGLAVALCGFLPRSDQQEFFVGKITMLGGVLAVLATAVWLLAACASHVLANPLDPALVLTVVGIVGGALAAIGLFSFVAKWFQRFGIYLVLGWCYVVVVGALPAGWSLLSTSSVPDMVSERWQDIVRLPEPAARPPLPPGSAVAESEPPKRARRPRSPPGPARRRQFRPCRLKSSHPGKYCPIPRRRPGSR